MRTVADAMVAGVAAIGPGATLQEASAAMLAAGTHAAVVVRDDKFAGLLAADDVAGAMASGADVTRSRAAELAHRDIVVAERDEPLPEAHLRMRRAQREIAAVVDASGRPVGLLIDRSDE
jgi:CBS domain-containing protein